MATPHSTPPRVAEAAPVLLASRLMSAEEFFEYEPPEGYRAELVDGEVVLMTGSGARHGQIAAKICMLLAQHVLTHRLGVVFAAETAFILDREPDTVRCPDASFLAIARMPAGGITDARLELAPDLVIEVLSPNDRAIEVEQRIAKFLASGTRLIWIINPKLRTATAYTPGAPPNALGEDDLLDAGDVVPGFACPLRDVLDW